MIGIPWLKSIGVIMFDSCVSVNVRPARQIFRHGLSRKIPFIGMVGCFLVGFSTGWGRMNLHRDIEKGRSLWFAKSRALLLVVLLAGCAAQGGAPHADLRKYGLTDHPVPASFEVCDRFGCRGRKPVRLSGAQWGDVVRPFSSPPATPEEERRLLGEAVALLERMAGEQTGSDVDVARNVQAGPGQLDCVAESVNTSIFLLLLEDHGLLRHHRVAAPVRRGVLIFFPHHAAMVTETASGREFVVDSWFRDNGRPPYFVPLEDWKGGWEPGPDTQHREAEASKLPATWLPTTSTENIHGL
jgi:hypothetical protein